MKYDFDTVYDRHHTNCAKYDSGHTDDPDLIPMWVADMDFKTLPDIPEALSKRVLDGIYGYSTIPEEYLESVVGWMERRHDFHVEQDWIVPTPGVVTAFHLAVEAYTKKEESVLVLTPVYYPFYRAIKNNGRRMVRMPLDLKDNQYTLDYKAFETKIIEENVKMMIFCNPHNPVGKVWTKEELKTIGDICKKHNVFVVSDEIHMDFVYAPHKHIAFYEVDSEYKNFSIILTAASKTFNLAALQTSAAIIADEKLRNQFKKVKMSHSISDPTILGFIATTVAYTKGDEWVDQLLDYIKGNMDYLDHFLKTECPGVSLIDPQGLYLAWVDMRTLGMSNEEQEDFMLNKAHLWLDEGYVFGEEGSGFERFNLACPRSTVEKACLQLKKALDERSA